MRLVLPYLDDPAVMKSQFCACECMAVYWIKEKLSNNFKLKTQRSVEGHI